jgi:tetratricopeptide (TPR) repeat protein
LDDGVDVYARLMELQLGASDWGGVLGNVERYLAVDPLVPLAYRLWSIAAEGVGDAEGVVAANRRLLLLDPPNPAEVNYRLAKALNTLGEEAARRHLLDALQDAPGNREALQLLLDMRSAERRVDGSVP